MEEKYISTPFVYRSYSKQELAQLYSPMLAPTTALKRFNKWIQHDPRFWKRLQRSGITVATKVYRRSQVCLIVEHLGEP